MLLRIAACSFAVVWSVATWANWAAEWVPAADMAADDAALGPEKDGGATIPGAAGLDVTGAKFPGAAPPPWAGAVYGTRPFAIGSNED